MKALSINTFQRGPISVGRSTISDRLVRIAAPACGVLLLAYLIFAASAARQEWTQPAVGSFAPAIPAFDNQFDPLEPDLYAKPRSTAYALVDNQFDPLEPDLYAKPRSTAYALVDTPFDPLLP